MKYLRSLLLLGCFGLSVSAQAAPMSEAEVRASEFAAKHQAAFNELSGEKVELTKVVFTQNDLLGFDEEVTGSAMSMKQYDYVTLFYRSAAGTVCKISADITTGEFPNFSDFRGGCRMEDGTTFFLDK